MTRRFQFSLRALMESQAFIGAGLLVFILSISAWLRLPRWWVWPAVMTFAFGFFGAAIGVFANHRLIFAAMGAVAWLVFVVVLSELVELL